MEGSVALCPVDSSVKEGLVSPSPWGPAGIGPPLPHCCSQETKRGGIGTSFSERFTCSRHKIGLRSHA